MAEVLIPEGSRALHIGPPKTGTTALQHAMHQARREMRSQGVRYLSRTKHDAAAARWATQSRRVILDRDRAADRWQQIVKGMRAGNARRRIFSSEALASASDDRLLAILDDIGTEGTYVVVTLRPLAKIVASQYQQSLVGGGRAGYLPWLDRILRQPINGEGQRRFWRRHRHDDLIRRWGGPVGFDRVIVVVLDESDFGFAPRAFEQILGLSAGTLEGREVIPNRSFTWAEAELVRRFNMQYSQTDLGPEVHAQVMATAQRSLKARVPGRDEARIVTPDWAIERANEIAGEMSEQIDSLGVRVVGDLGSLAAVKSGGIDEVRPPAEVPASVAAHFALEVGQAMRSLRDV